MSRRIVSKVSFSAQFLSDIVALAIDNAHYQRGEQQLQSSDILEDKLIKELKELAETEHPIEEIVDVVYYALCLAAQGNNFRLCELEIEILPRYPYSQEQIEAATLAKYKIRAEGPNSKDFERERTAIRAALK